MSKVLSVIACIIFYSHGYSQTDSDTNNASKNIIAYDDYNFSITLTKDSLSAGYFNDSQGTKYKYIKLPITYIHELDEYLGEHIRVIRNKKLDYTIIDDVSLDSLLAVKNILNKYKIYHPAVMMQSGPRPDPLCFLDSVRITLADMKTDYSEIAFTTIYKGYDAIRVAGPEAKNGAMYYTTKSFARKRYWSYFRLKSPEYQKNVPNLEAERKVTYILNGKTLTENYEIDLFRINNSNFVEMTLVGKQQLKNYSLPDTSVAFLITTTAGPTLVKFPF